MVIDVQLYSQEFLHDGNMFVVGLITPTPLSSIARTYVAVVFVDEALSAGVTQLHHYVKVAPPQSGLSSNTTRIHVLSNGRVLQPMFTWM